MRVLLMMTMVLLGCDHGTFDRRTGQDDAERIVWGDLYGMRGAAPPIEWINHPLLAGKMGFTIIGSRCQVVDASPGQTFDGSDVMPISATSFAHELMHYKTWTETGDVDPDHWRGDWNLADNIAAAELVRYGL